MATTYIGNNPCLASTTHYVSALLSFLCAILSAIGLLLSLPVLLLCCCFCFLSKIVNAFLCWLMLINKPLPKETSDSHTVTNLTLWIGNMGCMLECMVVDTVGEEHNNIQWLQNQLHIVVT